MDLKEIISNIHSQWKQAKSHLSDRCRAGGQIEMSAKLAECDMFKGTENLEQLADLFLSPQGVEFCMAAKFPSLATFRLLKPFGVERFGVYIDAGDITLRNPHKVVLIGRTSAKLIYTENKPLHNVMLLKGASAAVSASGWSVVAVAYEQGCRLVKFETGNAMILC